MAVRGRLNRSVVLPDKGVLGDICDEWRRTGICQHPNCRYTHPDNYAANKPADIPMKLDVIIAKASSLLTVAEGRPLSNPAKFCQEGLPNAKPVDVHRRNLEAFDPYPHGEDYMKCRTYKTGGSAGDCLTYDLHGVCFSEPPCLKKHDVVGVVNTATIAHQVDMILGAVQILERQVNSYILSHRQGSLPVHQSITAGILRQVTWSDDSRALDACLVDSVPGSSSSFEIQEVTG